MFPGLDLSLLREDWTSNEGYYSAGENAVGHRAAMVRAELRERVRALKDSEKKDIVVVTHGAFVKQLTGDPNIDLPKAAWKSFTVKGDENGDSVLVPV